MHKLTRVVGGLAISATVAAPAFAGVVYEQAGTAAACVGSCWTSTFGDGVGFRTYDDFVLANDAGIISATWRGFIQPNGPTGPVDPEVETWEISFSADVGGAPGAVLYSQSIAAADVTATLLGVSTFDGSVNVYEFSAILPTAFDALAGVTYWFAPLAVQEHFYPFFSWSAAADLSSGSTFQTALHNSDTFVRSHNRAFSLTAVPEPATWAVMVLGFGAAGAALRRRRELPAA